MADPAFVDTHVHFWDHSVPTLRWDWLSGGTTSGDRRSAIDAPRFAPPDLLVEADGTGLVGVVHGHCANPIEDPVAETHWLDGIANTYGILQALVGGCRLDDPDAADVLRRHATVGRLRGVRDPASVRYLDPVAASPAMAAASELGLSVEVRRRPEQVAEIARLASDWPDVTIVLTHACLPPDRSARSLRSWTQAMRLLARHDNVWCKISAVAGAADPNWTEASLRPWILTSIEVFGSQRCSLASNWPIDREFGTYRALVSAYRSISAELGAGELHDVFHTTAQRLYRLAVVETGPGTDFDEPRQVDPTAGSS